MSTSTLDLAWLTSRFDIATGTIDGALLVERRLADLRGCFADARAYEAALAHGNPVVYSVASVERADGAGDLHYGLGIVHPGRVGREYFRTRGHLHRWREAAELYVALAGEGAMLLESERSAESRLVPLREGQAVYVPGHTAHHTLNTAAVPLVYLGVYPAMAGHDYDAIARSNFRSVVVERDGRPVLVERSSFHA